MKKLFGLLIGATMMASIPVMADEQVLRDSELDTITAGTGYGYASAYADGDASVYGGYNIYVSPTSGSGNIYADIYPNGPTYVSLSAGGGND